MAKLALLLGFLGLACQQSLARDYPLTSQVATPTACQTCLTAVRIVEDFLCDPSATEFVVETVERKVCPFMGGGEKCHNMAEGLIPVVIQWFRATATPAMLCSASGVCGQTLLSNHKYNQPTLKLHDTNDCAMCKYVVDEISSPLPGASTPAQVNTAALKACAALPAQLAEGCINFLNAYEPLIATFVDSMSTDTTCSIVGVCPEKMLQTKPQALPLAVVQLLSKLQGPISATGFQNDACDMCKMAVLEAHSLVESPSVQAEILQYTEALCDSFPDAATQCRMYVDTYAPIVFTLLDTYLQPALCAELGMCPPTKLMGKVNAKGINAKL